MHFVLLALYTIVLLVWAVVGAATEGLLASILGTLVYLATITPGFQKYLETKITTYPMPIAEMPNYLRVTTKNLLSGYALRQVDGIDFLELDGEGRVRSLVKPNSPFNGRSPMELSEVSSTIPILILDDEGTADVDTAGPVLVKRSYRGRVRTKSIALLCDNGTLDAARVEAPILLADRDLELKNVRPESSVLDFASALDGARRLLLKSIRGEPLVAADAVGIEVVRPAKRSIPWFMLKRMKCKVGWRGFRCHWSLDSSEMQTLIEQKIAPPSAVAYKSLGEEPTKISVEVFNPRVTLRGSSAHVAVDIVLNAPDGQGVVSRLFANPVALTSIAVVVDDVIYDSSTGFVNYSKPRLENVQTALPLDPSVQRILIRVINEKIGNLIERSSQYDLKRENSWVYRFLRSFDLTDGRLRIAIGLGRCEDTLTQTTNSPRQHQDLQVDGKS